MYETIHKWLDNNLHKTIQQRTTEWHQARRGTVGGSTIATFTPRGNPYKKTNQLLMEKISGNSARVPNIVCQWGVLFEDILCRFTEAKHNTQVVGENVFCIHPEKPHFSYSPDGLCVLDGKITLLEFKCPYSRLPTAKMPYYYEPQVLMGMEMIDICEQALFVEAVIRKCKIQDALTTNYDQSLKQKIADTYRPIAVGVLALYHPTGYVETSVITDDDCFADCFTDDTFEPLKATTKDMSAMNIHQFGDLLDLYDNGYLQLEHTPIRMAANCTVEMLTTDLEHLQSDPRVMAGYCCWKIMHVGEHIIQKQPGWLDDLEPKVIEFLDVVQQCRDPANALIQHNIIDNYLHPTGLYAETEIVFQPSGL